MNLGNVLPSWFEEEGRFNKALRNDYKTIMPMMAEIIPSLKCPFRCIECSYRPQKESMGIWNNSMRDTDELTMTKETMKNAIEALNKVGTKHIVFTGGGEPLENKDVLLYGIELARKMNMSVCLYTNGLLMDEKIIKVIVSNVDVVRVSIYGASEEAFFSYTGCNRALYNKIFENIKKVLDTKEKLKSDIQVSLSFLLHPAMYKENECPNFIELLKARMGIRRLRGIHSVRFTPAVDYYSNRQIDKDFFEKIFKEVENEKEETAQYGIEFKNYSHRLTDLYSAKSYEECSACGLYAEIGPDGSMFQCCEKLFIDEYCIGNINRNSIEEIYSSVKRYTIWENVQKNINQCPPVCKPHEANKQFKLLNNISEKSRAEILLWRFNLLTQIDNTDLLGQYNYYES